MIRLLLGTITLVLALGPAAQALAPVGRAERARYLMGTLCTGTVEGADSLLAGEALAHSLDEIARLERVMSSWRDDSELALLNAAAGSPIECSEDLFAVLDSARAAAAVTGGAFDPTVEPLVRAWDLRGRGRVPSERALAEARALVDWRGLELRPGRRMAGLARSGMGVDLGGIGKGYALDRAGALLRRHGVPRALLNLGGEVLAIAEDADFEFGDVRLRAAPWTIDVAHPADRMRPMLTLKLANAAVSTSGQSERGFWAGGRRYGHILDPRSGAPVETRASVTVIASSATRADALSTGLLVAGRDVAARFAAAHPDVGILWLEPEGTAVRAWRWNVPDAALDAGLAVRWCN